MKTHFHVLLLVLLFQSFHISAQFSYPDIEDFGPATEVSLGYPDTDEGRQIIPLGIDLWEGDDVNTIHYGLVPPNSSDKPVVVFVHGYATNAHVWFEGNDNIYWDVYRDGYRSAFVSLTPNRHMWTNGHMLAQMLDKITAHYGVNDVVLVGWSKGAVDIDAALVHSEANLKVSQVFTLSAPHFGTGIAELANNILLSLVNIIFMQNNDATLCLKRGYMNYFRSLTDEHINNTVDYTTMGAWGNGPLKRLSIPQGYLHLAGGSKASGGNDGVVPYAGSQRPGGTELFSGQRREYFLGIFPYYTGPDETKLGHYEMTRGGLVWPHIKSTLSSSTSTTSQVTAANYNPNTAVSSRMQIITGSSGEKPFFVEENAGNVTIIMGPESEPASFSIRSQSGSLVRPQKVSAERLGGIDTNTIYKLGDVESGQYTIASNEEFAALIMTEGGVEATLNTGLSDSKLVYQSGEPIQLTLQLLTDDGINVEEAVVTGTIIRDVDLELNAVDDTPHIITFVKQGDQFVADVNQHLLSGIYNIAVTAEGDAFSKNVITSVAVVGSPDQAVIMEENTGLSIENIYPNPSHGQVNIELLVSEGNQALLIVYNIFGQKVKDFDLSNKQGKVHIQWGGTDDDLEPGLYILQLSDGNIKQTRKVMIE